MHNATSLKRLFVTGKDMKRKKYNNFFCNASVKEWIPCNITFLSIEVLRECKITAVFDTCIATLLYFV